MLGNLVSARSTRRAPRRSACCCSAAAREGALSSVYASDPYVLMQWSDCAGVAGVAPITSSSIIRPPARLPPPRPPSGHLIAAAGRSSWSPTRSTRDSEELLSHRSQWSYYASGALTNVSALDDFQLSGAAAHDLRELATAKPTTRARAAELAVAAAVVPGRNVAASAPTIGAGAGGGPTALIVGGGLGVVVGLVAQLDLVQDARIRVQLDDVGIERVVRRRRRRLLRGGWGGVGPVAAADGEEPEGERRHLASLTGVGLGAWSLQEL